MMKEQVFALLNQEGYITYIYLGIVIWGWGMHLGFDIR
jgi:hypothetical protein